MTPQFKNSNGSNISDDYPSFKLIQYEPIFSLLKNNNFGNVKNIIFASIGLKPEIVLDNSLENNICIVENEDSCLIYDLPIDNSNLLRDMVW